MIENAIVTQKIFNFSSSCLKFVEVKREFHIRICVPNKFHCNKRNGSHYKHFSRCDYDAIFFYQNIASVNIANLNTYVTYLRSPNSINLGDKIRYFIFVNTQSVVHNHVQNWIKSNARDQPYYRAFFYVISCYFGI